MCVNVTRDVDSTHLGPVLRVAQDLIGWDSARAQYVLVVIYVAQKHVQRSHPLPQTSLKLLPFGGGNDARHDVKRNQALSCFVCLAVFAVRIVLGTVDGERDADAAEHQIGLRTLELHRVWRLLRQPALELTIVRTDTIVPVVHFVERFVHRLALPNRAV